MAKRKQDSAAKDLGLLALRMATGGLMAGHGAQKLFGVLGGYGIEGTGGFLESLGLKPGKTWAMIAGASEFGSGASLALGLLTPVGAVSMFGPMVMAWATAHAGKPIWVTAGGAELPLMNMAAASALALTGPGRYSLDEALGIEVPTTVVALTVAGVVAGVVAGLGTRDTTSPAAQDEARDNLQSEADSAAADSGSVTASA